MKRTKGIKISKYIGVHRYSVRKFQSVIIVNNIRTLLGYYETELDAALAWDNYVRNNNLDRRLNFPDTEPENLIPNTRLVRLTRGKFAIVDEEDFEKVNQYRWHINSTGDLMYAVGVIKIGGKTKSIKLHRFVMNYPDSDIDHKDNNGLNCMKSNLRLCDDSKNQMNRRTKSDFTSKFRGVSWAKSRNHWRSMVGYKRKMIHLGCFHNEIEAARAYDLKANELFGEFARLNFPI